MLRVVPTAEGGEHPNLRAGNSPDMQRCPWIDGLAQELSSQDHPLAAAAPVWAAAAPYRQKGQLPIPLIDQVSFPLA
jgi:hypothetical protein